MTKLPQQIVIPIFSKAVTGKRFYRRGNNPGCGGTQFVAIMLACELAAVRGDFEIVLLNDNAIEIENCPDNLGQELLSPQDTPGLSLIMKKASVVICSSELLLKLVHSGVEIAPSRTVAWIHHPFISDLKLFDIACTAYVSCGTYAYYSNLAVPQNHWQISNIFTTPASAKRDKAPPPAAGELRCVYLGALIPGKGFHHIARNWQAIRQMYPNAVLDVIGGTETYSGERPADDMIPTDTSYAAILRKYITNEDIRTSSIIFHGNMGEEKYQVIAKANVALLNPTGSTEAYPASGLECMAYGVPVIASADYGMSETMRWFPELSIKSPDQISDKIYALMSDAACYTELSARSIKVANYFSSLTPEINTRWQRLIEKIASGLEPTPEFGPMEDYSGSGVKMLYRRLKVRRSLLKQRATRLFRTP